MIASAGRNTWSRFAVAPGRQSLAARAQLFRPLSNKSGGGLVLQTKDALRLVDAGHIGVKAIARVALKSGTVINKWDGPVFPSPTMHTVQFDENTHAAPTQGAEFISHGCADATNCRIVISEDRKSASFVVAQDVEQGEDLSFNYNTTEWDMNSCFPCACPSCQERSEGPRYVNGFKNMSLEERAAIAHDASPFIRSKAYSEALEHLMLLKNIADVEQDDYYNLDRENEQEPVPAEASA